MNEIHEGDRVYHRPTHSRCTIMEMFEGKALVRTEDNEVIECDMFDLAQELDDVNVF